jgi:hypothetical protein
MLNRALLQVEDFDKLPARNTNPHQLAVLEAEVDACEYQSLPDASRIGARELTAVRAHYTERENCQSQNDGSAQEARIAGFRGEAGAGCPPVAEPE